MLETLQRHVQVDFTVPNIYEVVVWAIKNANQYIDSQLIDTYELMVEKCNVRLYKSNKRVWEEDRWRYTREEREKLHTHFALDYRIVTHQVGGVECRYSNGYILGETAGEFIGDLMTIARNLGFNAHPWTFRRWDEKWDPGDKREYYYSHKSKDHLLFDVRAFKNRNLHIRFNQKFILALNVEHGRLKGWLRSPKEAAEELQDAAAAQYFKSNTLIGMQDPARLLAA